VAEGIGLLNQRAFNCTMGSNPISSDAVYLDYYSLNGSVVQLAERMLCKHEAIGSSPIISKVLVFLKKALNLYAFTTYFFYESVRGQTVK
jgi:uncharacterized protein (UPF0548 family)